MGSQIFSGQEKEVLVLSYEREKNMLPSCSDRICTDMSNGKSCQKEGLILGPGCVCPGAGRCGKDPLPNLRN